MAAMKGTGEEQGDRKELLGKSPGETVMGWSCWCLPKPPGTGRCVALSSGTPLF